MKSWLYLFILYGLTLKACIGEEVKKDHFPCMAFLYYHDASVRNPLYEHKRFLQNAILIKPEFLLTASIIEPPVVNNKYNGFPHKTLLARIGAISVDESLQYNEDENEQEREIVQVIRPFHYNHHVWWKSDISVLKSVTPFNVKFITFPILYGSTEQDCTTLTFVKNNMTMERQLMKYEFHVLPSSQCGTDFYEATMICGEYNYDSPPPDFCEGNAGGPLICADRLVGLQTFINSECKSPFLFQLLSKWQKFITCSISQTCHEDECSTTCSVSYKDIVENSKENQVLPKLGEEMKETLNVLPAEVTENFSEETEVTRTSAQPIYTFKSTSFAPTIIINTDGFHKNFDSSESIDKSKESEDGSVDSESMSVTTKGLDLGEKRDSNENKNDIDHSGNGLSLDALKNDEIEETAKGKEYNKIDRNEVTIERKDENALKFDEKNVKTEDEADESAEADKPEDGTGTTYAFATKGLTKISLNNFVSTIPPTTTKVTQIQTASAPMATPLSADKELRNGDKLRPEIGVDSNISGNEAPSEEKLVEKSAERRFEVSGERSHEGSGESSHESGGERSYEVSGERSHEKSGERSHEVSKEVGAERHFDGSGASVISVESASSGEKTVGKIPERGNDGSRNNGEEGSGGNSSEKSRKSADGIDLTGDITAESTGDKSDEKIERRDNSESVEEGDARRRIVSGKLVPPTVSGEVSINTITTNATEKVQVKQEKPELRTYSHGTKISYETSLIVSLFCRCLYCFYF